MAYLLIIFTILLNFPLSYVSKASSTTLENVLLLTKFTLLRCLLGIVTGLIVLYTSKGSMHFDTRTILISFLFALTLIGGMYFTIYAYRLTTVAINSLFTSASLIVPIVFGGIFLNEVISVYQIFAIILFFASVYLITLTDEKAEHKFTFKTLAVLMAILFSGGIGSMSMQMFTNYVPNGNMSWFIVLGYVFASVLLMIIYPFILKRTEGETKLKGKVCFYAGSSAAMGFVIQQFTTMLITMLPSFVLFPLLNGTAVIVSTIVGAVSFKEKITVKNSLGIILGLASLMAINLL